MIKALYDYQPEPAYPQELAFTRGDFFHVISREDDTDWYEACNPLIPSARGLVPVSYFEVIGKNERESTGSMPSRASTGGNDSGYSENGAHSRSDSSVTAKAPNSAPLQRSATSKSKGPMVYGKMEYSFRAERPDELNIEKGDPIILIARSHPQWFVAKPITGLGGPGLVPFDYINLHYMHNDEIILGKEAREDAVQAADIPRVEEWKRMTADYRDNSIELGKFAPSAGTQSIQSGMERMSLSSQQRSNRSNNDPHVSIAPE